MPKKIAIIGGGLSGASLYSFLKQQKNEVMIFEKSRGAGGRCSTRYIDENLIDHGTPYFQASDNNFISFCEEKTKENILRKEKEEYYPINGMNKLCSSLIDKEYFHTKTKIVSAKKIDEKWLLKDDQNNEYKEFDSLILTIPAPQILQMDIGLDESIKEQLKSVTYDSIATLMVYAHTLQNLMNPKLLKDSSFKKIIDNSSKYNYPNFSSYVLHLSEKTTALENITTKEDVERVILKKVLQSTGIRLTDDFHLVPHFWKYAFVSNSLESDYIFDQNLSLGICGDYFGGNDLESAYLSAKRLYENELH